MCKDNRKWGLCVSMSQTRGLNESHDFIKHVKRKNRFGHWPRPDRSVSSWIRCPRWARCEPCSWAPVAPQQTASLPSGSGWGCGSWILRKRKGRRDSQSTAYCSPPTSDSLCTSHYHLLHGFAFVCLMFCCLYLTNNSHNVERRFKCLISDTSLAGHDAGIADQVTGNGETRPGVPQRVLPIRIKLLIWILLTDTENYWSWTRYLKKHSYQHILYGHYILLQTR